ncbi:MAG: glycoside hydrolase family 9 protein [Spirochaetales bacterium]|nr:glycoside hydrolase family 9 protein [Spirochaetales bacterium]
MKKISFLLLLILLTTGVFSQNYNYVEVVQKSLFFYDVQRSGPLPAGNPVIWRADSTIHDGSDVGVDLTGGWFDAGDHVKFNLPMASSVLTLCWSIYEFKQDYIQSGLLDDTLERIKWATDYLIKCHPSANTYYYQVGAGSPDHVWWGSPEVLEEVMKRPAYKVTNSAPGSTVVGATSAALAMASMVFKEKNPAYAQNCLSHAIDLHNFANSTRSDVGYTEAEGFYRSFGGFWDEISASGVLLHMITGENRYLDNALEATENWATEEYNSPEWQYKWTHSWDDMHYMAQIFLARVTGEQVYIDSVERNLDFWMPGKGITYTPGGLAWLDRWGVLRYAANASLLAFIWSDESLGTASKKAAYRDFALKQCNYILGDNPSHRSYVIGFGQKSPRNAHHRAAHGSWYDNIKDPPESRHILFGALVGGPDKSDSYIDDRENYEMNEVACDYNAAFTGVMAKMAGLYGGTLLTDFPEAYFIKDEDPMPEYFARAIINNAGTNNYAIVTQTTNRSAWPATVKTKMSSRFFFDLSEVIASGFSADEVTLSISQNEGAKVTGPHLWNGTIYYIEIDFSGTPIYPGGRTPSERMCGFELKAPQGSDWDSSNDFSYQGLKTSFTWEPVDLTGYTENIPVYDNGKLLHGNEPGATPTPAETPSPVETPTPIETETPSPVLKGDADQSGVVNIVDALLTAQYYVNIINTIDEEAADVNCDNQVNIVDALLIAQYYVKMIDEFC